MQEAIENDIYPLYKNQNVDNQFCTTLNISEDNSQNESNMTFMPMISPES